MPLLAAVNPVTPVLEWAQLIATAFNLTAGYVGRLCGKVQSLSSLTEVR